MYFLCNFTLGLNAILKDFLLIMFIKFPLFWDRPIFVSGEHKILCVSELLAPQGEKLQKCLFTEEASFLKNQEVSGLVIAWNIWEL